MNTQNPNLMIAEVLYRLNVGATVTPLLKEAFYTILTHPEVKSRDAQLGSFLSALMVHGVTAEEVEILIRTALNIDGLPRYRLQVPGGQPIVAVAGSGKKGVKTFNVSTPACFTAAAGGAYVVKPGSRATSSVSGSRDFLDLVGALPLTTEETAQVLVSTGFAFYPIECYIPKFDAVYGGRTFGPTPLSFALPAIANPIVCDALLYGLSHPNVALSLEVLSRFRLQNVMVVSSSPDMVHFIDELAPFANNKLGRIIDDVNAGVQWINVREMTGNAHCACDEIGPGPSLMENIQRSVVALAGRSPGPQEDIIALNAAAILLLARKVTELQEGFILARELIRSGAALSTMKTFILGTGGTLHSLNTLLGEGNESNTS